LTTFNLIDIRNVSSILKSVLIISVILFPLLIFLESSIKYPLYVFSIILTSILFLVIQKKDYKFKLKIPYLKKILDYFFIGSSLVVFVSGLTNHVDPNSVFPFSLIISFFLPGWVILRLLGIDDINKKPAGIFVLSFTCSLGLTSLIFFLTTIIQIDSLFLLPGIYLIVSTFPLLKDGFNTLRNNQQLNFSFDSSDHRIFDLLILGWIVTFFIFIIATFYPQISDNPFSDIYRLSSYSNQLLVTPDIFSSDYPWYHFITATVKTLSPVQTSFFQYGIAFLSIIVVIAFYSMSKIYLSDINARAHRIATVFFFIFAGFGWIFFIQEYLTMLGDSNYFDLLQSASNASYFDILYGQGTWLWYWFRPLTLGFTIFFVLVYFMKQENIKNRNYIIIVSLLLLSLSQIHFPEMIIFSTFIFLLALICPKLKLHLQETSISVIIALILSVLLVVSYQKLFNVEFSLIPLQYSILLIFLSGLTLALLRFSKRPKIKLHLNSFAVILILLFVYAGLFFYWFSTSENVNSDDFKIIHDVPWEFYPVLLGIVGALSIPGTILVWTKFKSHPIVIFTILLIGTVIFGRLLTILNSEVFDTGYWEKRIIPFVFVSATILASLFIVNVFQKFTNTKNQVVLKKYLVLTIVTLLVFGGTLSTLLSVEYNILSTQNIKVSAEEKTLLSVLDTADPYSILITKSPRSLKILESVNVGFIPEHYSDHLWASHSPELTLEIMSYLQSPTIIYLQPNDLEQIREHEQSYINSHLLKVAPITYEGIEGKVLQFTINSNPSPTSELVLVVPEKKDRTYYAYDILSLGNFNYTTSLLSDINSLKKAKIILTPNEEFALKVIDYKKRYGLQFEKLIVLNLDGYGSLVDVSYSSSSPKIIFDDDGLADWMPGGSGTGKGGIPTLKKDHDEKSYGMNSLLIQVENGSYNQWSISKTFNEIEDFSKFDHARFNWLGKNSGKIFIVEFLSDSGKYWYSFKDSWTGWKQVILPLHSNDGLKDIFGISVSKISDSNASWQKITGVRIKSDPLNEEITGAFNLDYFVLDHNVVSSRITSVLNSNEIHFPTKIDLPISLSEKNYDIKAYYDIGVPFILQKTGMDFEMFYVNIFPIIEKFESSDFDARKNYKILGSLLDFLGFDLPSSKSISKDRSKLFTGNQAAFKTASFNGDIMIQSSSIIVNLNESSIIINSNGDHLTLNEVTHILPVNIDVAIVNVEEVIFGSGTGYYAKGFFNSSSIKLSGNPTKVLIIHGNGSETIISDNEIEINLPDSNMFLRQPKIISDGNIKFEQFYAYEELSSKFRVMNKDIWVEGKLTYNTKVSDVFTIIVNTELDGKVIIP